MECNSSQVKEHALRFNWETETHRTSRCICTDLLSSNDNIIRIWWDWIVNTCPYQFVSTAMHSRLWHVIYSTTLGKMVLVLKKNRLLCSVLPCHWHHAVPPRVKDASLGLVSGQAWIIWNPLRSSVLENIFSTRHSKPTGTDLLPFKAITRLFTVPYISVRSYRSLSSTGRHLGLLMRAKLGRVQYTRG